MAHILVETGIRCMRLHTSMTVESSLSSAPAPRGSRRYLWIVWALACAITVPVAMIAIAACGTFGTDAVLGDMLVVPAGTKAGEYIHFRLMRATYLAEIAAMPAATEPRLRVFLLSQDGWFSITNYHLVVYDESDEVALPEAQRSPAWQARVSDTPLESGVPYVAPQGEHFYIVRVSE
jgi:hypothetical protein